MVIPILQWLDIPHLQTTALQINQYMVVYITLSPTLHCYDDYQIQLAATTTSSRRPDQWMKRKTFMAKSKKSDINNWKKRNFTFRLLSELSKKKHNILACNCDSYKLSDIHLNYNNTNKNSHSGD
ncbi:hypothetical protein C0J52_08125 [Blattella germanica]|nr:hypothetical protein C0J52_08125 [Blattella germanica]